MPIMSHEDSLIVIEGINNVIKNSGIDTNKISDGYHSFGELYEHRIILFIALLRWLQFRNSEVHEKFEIPVWRSKRHHDGTSYDGWFIIGIEYVKGRQISYHFPMSYWDETNFIVEHERAPEWDGHTSNDVLERLKNL